MADAAIGVRPAARASIPTLLTGAILAILVVHAILLLLPGVVGVAPLRVCTAAVPALAAVCGFWRGQRLPLRERMAWRWISLSLLLWAAGQIAEAWIGHSAQASNTAVDGSDFLYMAAAFPLLLALSSTRQTEAIRAAFALDTAQIAVAFVLIYVRLLGMPMPPAQADTIMSRIYGVDCLLLAVAALVRLAVWTTQEERRRVRLVCAVVWMYLPVELGMDYASSHWHLREGTLLDLLWSIPFAYAGWQALRMPVADASRPGRRRLGRGRLLIESLCPLFMTAAVFALAVSIASQHLVLALGSIFLLLLIQGLHAGMVQLNYVDGQHLLLEREQELQDANTELERLTLLDPLTGIPNRRRFTSALEDAWRRALRRREPIAVLMIDVDYFKGVNDLHGHIYGDECLTVVTGILGKIAARPDDLVARYGGEEFVVLLPETNEAGAWSVAERMHGAVAAQAMGNDASPFQRRLTVSIGIGAGIPEPGMSPALLVEIADQALYDAKRQGRNRICTRSL